VHSVDHDTDGRNLSFAHLQTIEAHSKVVNMCCMLDYNNVITCSREPDIKMFCLDGTDLEQAGVPSAVFTGHEMSVTTVSA
jgi:hypothetical protein